MDEDWEKKRRRREDGGKRVIEFVHVRNSGGKNAKGKITRLQRGRRKIDTNGARRREEIQRREKVLLGWGGAEFRGQLVRWKGGGDRPPESEGGVVSWN